MNKIDHLGLDGRSLRTFLTVLEEVSVSKAATRLGVSQSAVSHTLDRLRLIFDDPLFIRDGRGIRPTTIARSLREPVETILDNLKSLTDKKQFDPFAEPVEFTIAANDFQRGFIFPSLIRELYTEGINHRFHFVSSGIPSVNLTLASRCQLLITPAPPQGKDIIQEPLFQSEAVCFYDSKSRTPPTTWDQFVESKYVEVKFSGTESSLMAISSIDISLLNNPTVTVPNFSALPEFIKETDLITTQLVLMAQGPLKGLDHAPLPSKTEPVTVYMAWHRRYHDDPAHQWLRQRITGTVDKIISV
jgi:DNA-binding transcriptional LysR family regulator